MLDRMPVRDCELFTASSSLWAVAYFDRRWLPTSGTDTHVAVAVSQDGKTFYAAQVTHLSSSDAHHTDKIVCVQFGLSATLRRSGNLLQLNDERMLYHGQSNITVAVASMASSPTPSNRKRGWFTRRPYG